MKSFNADRQRNLEINNLLQRIKYEADKQQASTFIYFPIFVINGRDIKYKISPSGQILFKELKKMDAIELRERSYEEINKTLEENRKLKDKSLLSEGYLVKPIEPKFSQLCKKYENKANESQSENKELEGKRKENNLIIKKMDGEFYYKNKLVRFTDKETIYYLIFECLYENSNPDGFCSYETIDKYLKKHGKDKYDDNRQRTDRIKNGITNLFRFSHLSQKTPDGKELIKIIRGNGVILHNPQF